MLGRRVASAGNMPSGVKALLRHYIEEEAARLGFRFEDLRLAEPRMLIYIAVGTRLLSGEFDRCMKKEGGTAAKN